MAVNAVGSTDTSQQAVLNQAVPGQGSPGDLDKNTFLKLLITQMQNQDPLSPVDNATFVAQLAQFSTLEQMQNLNLKFDDSLQLSRSLNNSTAAGLIGRQVRASGDTVQLADSGSVELGYFLTQEAKDVTVTVYNAQGALVRSFQGAETSTGAHTLDWDGRNMNGERVAPGKYTFKVSAVNQDGGALKAITVVDGVVEGVTYVDGTAYLIVDGREVPFADLLEVHARP